MNLRKDHYRNYPVSNDVTVEKVRGCDTPSAAGPFASGGAVLLATPQWPATANPGPGNWPVLVGDCVSDAGLLFISPGMGCLRLNHITSSVGVPVPQLPSLSKAAGRAPCGLSWPCDGLKRRTTAVPIGIPPGESAPRCAPCLFFFRPYPGRAFGVVFFYEP